MMEIDFDILTNEVLNILDKNPVMVLSTSCNDRVTARSMSCVHKKLKISFQTGRTSLKYKQIEKNSNVALCVGNMQIEGKAIIKGYSTEDQNKEFVELFRRHYPEAFKRYTYLKGEVVIEVDPKLITLWKHDENSKSCRDILYVSEGKAFREYANI